MKHIKGTTEEYDNETYKVIENKIVPSNKKRSVLIYLNLIAIGLWIVLSIISIMIFKPIGSIPFDITLLFDIILILFIFILYIVIHEFLHAVSFILFDPNVSRNDIKFGISIKSGVAYCISKKPTTVKSARLSLMMPVYIICIPLYITSLLISSLPLALITVYFFVGSIGDFYYLYLLKNSDGTLYIKEDMPTKTGYEIGYVLYQKEKIES